MTARKVVPPDQPAVFIVFLFLFRQYLVFTRLERSYWGILNSQIM